MKSKMMLKIYALFFLLVAVNTGWAQKKYAYQSFQNDPLGTRIYTLDNGLKVYMSVYKDAPQIQTYIAVRAGSKNDPSETTGLAHYFEHMMFKGSNHFGTMDFNKESKMIGKIDSLFEIYRVTKDENKRAALYHKIDSISYEASKIAIPNEYDKMMSMIGATGTNAYTSMDETVYVENIPSNQLENWAKIEADRFASPILRLFHTELETIYEEKNMTLTKDNRKSFDALLSGLFKKHTYGTQTTIGDAEHLKNPSMRNINKFFSNYYVPNNMAICMSGDFNPDEAIQIVDKYFGQLKPGNVPSFTFDKEAPITAPIIKNVYGPDAESMILAYRFGGINSEDAKYVTMMDMILSNRLAGLIDLNVNQKQLTLGASASPMILADYSIEMLTGSPKSGQTLEEVKDILLAQVDKVKKGEFSEELLPAIINDLKLNKMKSYESNEARAKAYVESFIRGTNWENEIKELDELSKITKQQIVDFANKNLGDNYVVVYKRTGVDTAIHKVNKPAITPIYINRDAQSDFVKEISESGVSEIQPVFVDYQKDMKQFTVKSDIPVLYKENTDNKTFDLYYVFEMGSNNDLKLSLAAQYLDFLGTSKYSPEDLKKEFYKLGATMGISVSADRIYISLSGLSENMAKSIALLESLLVDAQPNQGALDNLRKDIFKYRVDAKKNPRQIFNRLVQYGIYGDNSPATNFLSEKELNAVTSKELLNKIKSLSEYKHKVLYYGSQSTEEVKTLLNQYHKVAKKLKDAPKAIEFKEQKIDSTVIYFVQYDMKQAQVMMLSQSVLFNKELQPIIRMFNEYFGGSMNSIVFQELREARSLAYTASNGFSNMLNKKDAHYYNNSFIQTQADKLNDAMVAFYELLNNMPESQRSFELARYSIIQSMRTDRITKSGVLFSYLENMKMGYDYDSRKDVFEKVPSFTFADLKAFQEKYIKNQPKAILVMGDEKLINMDQLKKYGKVVKLSLNDIFKY